MTEPHRVDWVDYAKGFCIVFVVMMHSTLGVGAAAGGEGFMHYVVAFAKPFRMPDFFLISGLFLARVIDRDWRTYIDRKVVHFVYFYILWMTIQFAFKAPGLMAGRGAKGVALLYFEGFIEPFGTLWFIYLLPLFFIVAKLTRSVPPAIVWIGAALLEMSHLHTGWTLPDESAARFVYFYTGYILAPHIFALAKESQDAPLKGIVILTAWAIANGAMVFLGYSEYPGVSLALGLIGAAAVVRLAALLSRAHMFSFLRYLGEHSIVIYLAFFLPMAVTRTMMLKAGIDIGTASLVVTIAGVLGSVAIWWALRGTPLKFLYARPQMFRLAPRAKAPVMQPAQ
jgi:uncharacterized membrane protein YcfT